MPVTELYAFNLICENLLTELCGVAFISSVPGSIVFTVAAAANDELMFENADEKSTVCFRSPDTAPTMLSTFRTIRVLTTSSIAIRKAPSIPP